MHSLLLCTIRKPEILFWSWRKAWWNTVQDSAGESGVFRKAFKCADDTVDTVIKYLLNDIQPLPMDEIVVMVNGFGRTGDMEMAIIGKRVLQDLRKNGIKVHHILVGHTCSPQDSSGFSVSLMSVDEELKKCYDFPAWSPLLQGFTGRTCL